MAAINDDSIAGAKRAMRARGRERRRAVHGHAARGEGAAVAAARNFVDAIDPEPGCVVAGYWPIDAELDVRPLMAALGARGHICALPAVVGERRPLAFRAWAPGERLEAGVFGTSVPPADAPRVTPGLVLVPLVAFDGRGHRLGYGGGYYDMTLVELRAGGRVLAVGMGFEDQRVDRVPNDGSDQRLDWVVTEAEARAFA